jgi:UDP-N-acetyl-D-galactosamine dehydrogenase
VDVHDPRVDSREAHREYGYALVAAPGSGEYDAVVLAVPHREFLDAGIDAIRAYGRDGAVVYDVKGALPRDAVDGRL